MQIRKRHKGIISYDQNSNKSDGFFLTYINSTRAFSHENQNDILFMDYGEEGWHNFRWTRDYYGEWENYYELSEWIDEN